MKYLNYVEVVVYLVIDCEGSLIGQFGTLTEAEEVKSKDPMTRVQEITILPDIYQQEDGHLIADSTNG